MNWKSPRQTEEDIKEYKRKRFEDYMGKVDRGEMSRELAIQAVREEIEALDSMD